MFVQNNPTPWVVLILLIAALLFASGFFISDSEPLNPARASQEAITRATFSAIAAESTQMAIRPTQAAIQATLSAQAQIAEATAAPLHQAATQAAAGARLVELEQAATATAIASQSLAQARNLEFKQTQTAQQASRIANEQTIDMVGTALIYIVLAGLGAAVAYWTIASGRAREHTAQAKMLAEQRRTMEVRAAIKIKSTQAGILLSKEIHSNGKTDTKKGDANDYSHLPLAK